MMPEFILDSAGTVDGRDFADLDLFTQGYIEALFFTDCASGMSMVDWDLPENVEAREEGATDGQIPTDAGFSDLHPDSLASIIADCAAFQEANAADLAAVYELEPGRYANGATIDERRAGQFFWYARNGHGVAWTDDFSSDDPGADILERLQNVCRGMVGRNVSFGTAADGADSPTGYGFVFVE
jgi:hypothetical protein